MASVPSPPKPGKPVAHVPHCPVPRAAARGEGAACLCPDKLRSYPSLTEFEEVKVRNHPVCPGCGQAKDLGCLVCWPCFKYRNDVEPFKYFEGYLREWLHTIDRPTLEAQGILQAEGGAT